MSPTFHSLSIRNYRIWFLGGLVSNIGTWAGRVGQDWLVLTELTDHSSTALGTVTGLQFLDGRRPRRCPLRPPSRPQVRRGAGRLMLTG